MHNRIFLIGLTLAMFASSATAHDLYRSDNADADHDHDHSLELLAQAYQTKGDRSPRKRGKGPRIKKPTIDDTLIANMYADNWFKMYINGELICVDSIRFMPHNVISVNVFPTYPMTIAVMAKDNADAKTGMEYNNSNIGDGGFILKFSDGTVTSSKWKAKKVSWGPVNRDTENPRTVHIEIPKNWHAPDFDDSKWSNAKEYSEEIVRPKKPFYEHDFKGAKFIWSDDLELDNTILLRYTVKAPPNGDDVKEFPGLDNPNGNEPKVRVPEQKHAHAFPIGSTYFIAAKSELPAGAPETAKAFARYNPNAKIRWDNDYLYIESNGLPKHSMMVGITAWQQQVPLPQPYTGNNAWRIPLKPVPAKNPMSAKTNFFRGAIALAVNGVPIFNPIKNDGRTDTNLAGELDQWGGHCGRGDDYHYHIAPVHLEKVVGKGNPIAYALDGYPILAYEEANGTKPKLDRLNGHKDANGHYHYHATKTYPYLNGGFYGEVTERGGQVDPQPRAQGVRPYTRPLRGAKITGFESPKPNAHKLTYQINGRKGFVSYVINENGSVTFTYTDTSGKTTTETYQRRERRGGDRPRGDKPPRRKDDRRKPPPRDDRRRPPRPDERRGDVGEASSTSVSTTISVGSRSTTASLRSSTNRKPNFVFFLIDDMGWRDMGFSGNKVIETPHTDKLAREGVIFTQAYASAPNCAPTRACLLSGQYTPRHGVYTVVDERHKPGLPHHKILAAQSNAAMSGDVVTIARRSRNMVMSRPASACGTLDADGPVHRRH